jgi:hypothetical protein
MPGAGSTVVRLIFEIVGFEHPNAPLYNFELILPIENVVLVVAFCRPYTKVQ